MTSLVWQWAKRFSHSRKGVLAGIRSADVIVQLPNGVVLRANDPVHQIAYGQNSDYAVGFENRKMPDLPRGHQVHTVAEGLVERDGQDRRAHDLAYSCFARLPAFQNHFAGIIA